MTGTIKFKEFGAKPCEEIKFDEVTAEHWGIKARFRRGNDDETRRPKVYKLNLYPGSGTGNWEVSERDSGQIEHVKATGDKIIDGVFPINGVIIVDGLWVEAGIRMEMNVTITNASPRILEEVKAA